MPQGPIRIQAVPASFSALNVTAAKVLKATPGSIGRVVVNTAGTAGDLTINDCATTGAAAASNEILKVPYGSLTDGQVIDLNFPCKTGITISAITTGGVVAVAYS